MTIRMYSTVREQFCTVENALQSSVRKSRAEKPFSIKIPARSVKWSPLIIVHTKFKLENAHGPQLSGHLALMTEKWPPVNNADTSRCDSSLSPGEPRNGVLTVATQNKMNLFRIGFFWFLCGAKHVLRISRINMGVFSRSLFLGHPLTNWLLRVIATRN